MPGWRNGIRRGLKILRSRRRERMNRTMEKYRRLAPEISSDTGVPKDAIEKVLTAMETRMSQCRRQKNPPPPPGSISLSAATRKYNVYLSTIQRWVKRGLIPVVLRSRRYKYIDESKLVETIKRYRKNPGQGKQTLRTKTTAME